MKDSVISFGCVDFDRGDLVLVNSNPWWCRTYLVVAASPSTITTRWAWWMEDWARLGVAMIYAVALSLLARLG